MILVTGGAGYIGSHVLLELAKKKEQVVVVDNLSTGRSEALQNGEILVQVDLRNVDEVRKVFEQYRPDSVIHFAASIVAPESVQKPLEYYRNNTVNTLQLIELCHGFQVKNFIFSSTAAVYGMAGEKSVTETSPLAPISPYGWSKRMSEQILLDTCTVSQMRCVILRYFNVAGADPDYRVGQTHPQATHLFKRCYQVASGQISELEIFGDDYQTVDGTGVRDYIHVSDLANAHVKALEYLQNGGKSDIFNVGYGHGYSVKQVVEVMRQTTGHLIPTVIRPRRDGDPAQVVADNSKIISKLNWRPQFDDLPTIARHGWEWEKKLDVSS